MDRNRWFNFDMIRDFKIVIWKSGKNRKEEDVVCMIANETNLSKRPNDTGINNSWYKYGLQKLPVIEFRPIL